MTVRDDDRGWEVGSSGMGHASSATRSSRCLARSPTYHFKRLLEGACPNHAYPIRHKLKDCGIMRSFMTSGSLIWGAEPRERPNRSGTTPFPEENTVMAVLWGCPPGREVLHVQPRPQDLNSWCLGPRGLKGVTVQALHPTQIYIYINIRFLQLSPEAREKRRGRGSVPWTSAGFQCLL
jgi:hypothetical protein